MPTHRTATLFSRTGFTIAFSLLFFFIFAFGATFFYILAPMARQSSDDLAALIMFSAQTWAELPPDTRYDFAEELSSSHGLTLLTTTPELEPHPLETPYLHFLENALSRRAGEDIVIKTRSNDELWLWVDIPMLNQTLRFGFAHTRIGVQPSVVILWVILGGAVVTILTSLLLVRRLTHPLERLYVGTRAFASGKKLAPIPESGPNELATLTTSFNDMMQQIHQLMENRTILLAGISHDLRTPITRMKLALEMLGDKPDPSLIESMRNDLDEMAELIGRTMEMAKGFEVGNEEGQDVDLSVFIEQLIAQYQTEEGKEIDMNSGTFCSHTLNTVALRRVLTNLLENALHYGGDEVIQVFCECVSDKYVVQICDKGIGIPIDKREAVFQPFYRLEASRNKATGGSGLGLAIVKQLCKANGWHVQLLPKQDGGTIAQLEIPLEPANTRKLF
ncbi:MAG: Two-component sensor histidine kinase [uncultured Thiotrichaceae bacterium]|uniref:histidine kinase n=1 Tax=uncultured Thiotrichaceae bacterium TaxID=298394 RepID=A0A6S6UAR2_9GAMM|nr:MAG: Two-component sensor histidine kinase [uncultured Thiotrichaceae bacterium]